MLTVKQRFNRKTCHDAILARLEKLTEESPEARNLPGAPKRTEEASCDSGARE